MALRTEVTCSCRCGPASSSPFRFHSGSFIEGLLPAWEGAGSEHFPKTSDSGGTAIPVQPCPPSRCQRLQDVTGKAPAKRPSV